MVPSKRLLCPVGFKARVERLMVTGLARLGFRVYGHQKPDFQIDGIVDTEPQGYDQEPVPYFK